MYADFCGFMQKYADLFGFMLELFYFCSELYPSTAADFCIGSSNNGWLVWKDKDGQTLDAVYRKQLE